MRKKVYHGGFLDIGEGLLDCLELVHHHACCCLMVPTVRQRQAMARLGGDFVSVGQVPLITVVLQRAEAVPALCPMGKKAGPWANDRLPMLNQLHLGAGQNCYWPIVCHHSTILILG